LPVQFCPTRMLSLKTTRTDSGTKQITKKMLVRQIIHRHVMAAAHVNPGMNAWHLLTT